VADVLDRDAAAKLLQSGLGMELHKASTLYVAPLYWFVRGQGEIDDVKSATVFFIDCGDGPFAVTAAHVVDEIFDDQAAGRVLLCQMANVPIDPVDRLIDMDEDLDLATFRVDPREIAAARSVPLTIPKGRWPPPAPKIGSGVLFSGYPGHERLREGPRRLNFGIYAAAVLATSVGDRDIKCQIEREHMVATLAKEIPAPYYDLGGISGAPLLTLVESNGVVTWQLGGVIYEAYAGEELGMGMIVARRADFIGASGKLNRSS
jgi:hypothetical protein